MKAVFTIVAKNYYTLAITLGDSLKATNPDYDFFIILADEALEDIDIKNEKYKVIEAKELEIENWKEMAFKYDVVEFNTSIKPFVFNYLFNKYNMEKLIYMDPDICIYSKLDELEQLLEDNFAVVTPHVNNSQIEWNGAMPEKSFLLSGIFNLGFIALRNTDFSVEFLKWWENKLSTMCYTDKSDGYFYDQKWIDFLPSFYDGNIKILKDCGYNFAWWNMHERVLIKKNGEYFVENESKKECTKLVFFHFSGFNVKTPNLINRRFSKNENFELREGSLMKELFSDYSEKVMANDYAKYVEMKYKYDYFNNGIQITKFYRRIFRELVNKDSSYMYEDPFRKAIKSKILEMKFNFTDPFDVGNGSYYEVLNHNKLLGSKNILDKVNLDNENFGLLRKIKILTKIMKLIKNILGVKNYLMIMKFLEKYSKEEYQTFLIINLDKDTK